MQLGEQIKKIRLAKGLSQKEVIVAANIGKAQFSRIENNKIDPTFSTIEKIANAMDCTLSELFNNGEILKEMNDIKEIHSFDKSVMEKVKILEHLDDDEKKSIYSIIDGLATKQKLKQILSNALTV